MSDGTQNTGQRAAARTGRRRRSPGIVGRRGHMEYDRILFFSDAVFAIAITLLVVELPEPSENALDRGQAIDSGHLLRAAASTSVLGFWISFGVIGLFWIGHHGLFRYVKAIDRPLMLLNLVFLGSIAFLPYPTDVLSSTSDQKPAVVL
jgi:uncharacterized membrane protein